MDIVAYRPEFRERVIEFISLMFTQRLKGQFEPTGKDADILNITDRYQMGGGEFWVVLQNERVIGTAAIRPLGRQVAYLRRMYVLPEYQGLGIGSNLLATRIAWAREHGFTSVVLDTTNRSTKALRLFRQLGFVEIPAFPTDHFAEVFMELKL